MYCLYTYLTSLQVVHLSTYFLQQKTYRSIHKPLNYWKHIDLNIAAQDTDRLLSKTQIIQRLTTQVEKAIVVFLNYIGITFNRLYQQHSKRLYAKD